MAGTHQALEGHAPAVFECGQLRTDGVVYIRIQKILCAGDAPDAPPLPVAERVRFGGVSILGCFLHYAYFLLYYLLPLCIRADNNANQRSMVADSFYVFSFCAETRARE